MIISYAQNQEDVILFRALSDIENGFYIDIGAFDPTHHSVTKIFYDRGWCGVNVEPIIEQFEKLSADRPRDINLNVAVAPEAGSVTLYALGGLSTTVKDIATRHGDAGHTTKPVTVPAMTLEGVMALAPSKDIHFLKIDIEGAEEIVINATRFNVIRPWIIVVEATAPLSQESTYLGWDKHLVSEGYKFIYFDGLNRYYLAKEHASRKQRLSIQPNIFDDYKTFQMFNLEQIEIQAEQLRQVLLAGQVAYNELLERFHGNVVEFQKQEKALRDQADSTLQHADRLQAKIVELHKNLAAAYNEVNNKDRQLAELYRSTSWRLTAPLRGVAKRNPRIVHGLRRAAASNPRLTRLVKGGLRAAWRVSTLRSPFPATPQPSAVALAAAPAVKRLVIERPPERVWFFLGDTIDWLNTHQHLTGVGRVTAELFAAAVENPDVSAMPCAFADDGISMVCLETGECVAYLAERTGSSMEKDKRAHLPRRLSSPAPVQGDHVVFTGVVWSPAYQQLLEGLGTTGVGFSVLVYDVIPLQHPEYVSREHAAMFSDWLRVVLTFATNIFVCNLEVRNGILRWAALAEIPVLAEIVPITFGVNKIGSVTTSVSTTNKRISDVREENFVLSVGTIDRRKNQAALCRVWATLHATPGIVNVPQLVLAGRGDLDLAAMPADVVQLMASQDIVILNDLADDHLSFLYDKCLFTVFPSLCEGHGLPVAESLLYGKVCIASDLAVIRAHAGAFPWYFPAGDDAALFGMIHRAVTDQAARTAAEQDIALNYNPPAWRETWRAMSEVARKRPSSFAPASVAPPRPDMDGLPQRVDIREALQRAERWCVDTEPEVSILVLNWHAAGLTMECVRQVWANTEGVRYEIIIADNGSDPASLEQLRHLGRGVHLLELGVNRFFGEANNIAAEHAKGRFVCLLNNDAFVRPGWLTTLRDAIDGNDDVGAAGPLFLFPNGVIQEAGAMIDSGGYPRRIGRDQPAGTQVFSPSVVDYISAAALLVKTDSYKKVGGFDLAFEPAYYEDVDLCFKLRAIGQSTLFRPDAEVVHIEGAAANNDPAAVARRNALGDLNRSKFIARWSKFLLSRSDADLEDIAASLKLVDPPTPAIVERRRKAALFTPYALTPGGGERFLLTIASILAEDHDTTIVTSHPYSRMRLQAMERELAISLNECRLATESEFLAAPAPDLQITIGNHIVPPIVGRGARNFFVCQFPFPLADNDINRLQAGAGHYDSILVYSDYVRTHVLAAQKLHRMPAWPVEVVHPPVQQYRGDPKTRKPMVLTVGRYFKGGHAKRHDLMIEAFRLLLERTGADIEMHICGSSAPDPVHMGYLSELRAQADGLPVVFHVNASQERLAELYRDAELYWHATGLGTALAEQPWAAEHFGITVLEAMSAGCVSMAFDAAGPKEIISDGVDGILYGSLAELVDKAAGLIEPGSRRKREAMAEAAIRRAAEFETQVFRARVRKLLLG